MKIKTKLISFLILFYYATIYINSSYAQNWSLDATFNGNGKVITPLLTPRFQGDNAAAIQTDGKLLVTGIIAGLSSADFAVVRNHLVRRRHLLRDLRGRARALRGVVLQLSSLVPYFYVTRV
jgi:hypothetical protein